ncbi:MAG TPA: thymidylate kinase [Candidatus Saccharimonadia bacterium]|nr:thymidylate kinase [Candidatus Saccharimonadia bacterium]
MKRGVFIAIEGSDGSGKTTHTTQLVAWLRQQGHDVVTFDFPQYGTPSAYFVEQYLAGRYGGLADIGPYRGSLFYAMDRYDAGFKIRAALSRGAVVVSNRYVASNMGHQGAKLDDAAERQAYFAWNEHLEFEILGIPRPDLNVVLRMPAELAQHLAGQVTEKTERAHLRGQKRDLHEDNLDHLRRAEQTYAELCRLFPAAFTLIECADGQRIRPIDEIQGQVRRLVTALLAKHSNHKEDQ